MMDEMCYIVATKHGGSLKAEHGTGRNVAPYVEMEWGATAYNLMWELKELFDPEYVLNPGVILNRVRRASTWSTPRETGFHTSLLTRIAPDLHIIRQAVPSWHCSIVE